MSNASVPLLASINQKYPDIGRALQYLQDVANNIGQQINAAPVGITSATPAPAQLSVTGGAGIIHVVISDPNPTYRGNSYTIEIIPSGGSWDTQALPIHLGPSRSYRGNLGSGVYSVRACSGYNTSSPSPWIYADVDATGGSAPGFPTSTGSGTGGGGWGNLPFTGANPPKRA